MGVGTSQHDLGHGLAELPADFLQYRHAALVFHRVVQQGGNGFILAAAIFQHEARHAQQMRHIGHAGNLALLILVQFGSVDQGGSETGGKKHGGRGWQKRCLDLGT